MIIAVLSILVALLVFFGAAPFIVRGVEGGEIQPFFIGVAGMVVSILMATAGISLWRHWRTARQLVIAAGVSSVLFHVYAALPPHRTVGILALLVGAGFGLILLCVGLISTARKVHAN